MKDPRVSVVMSCWNDELRVAAAVDSIQQQILVDWELIAVNDGSTDGTGQILNNLAKDDDRIRVMHQQNTGLTKALIKGCNVARASYIARQDADDTSRPRRLEHQANLLDHYPDVGFVSCFTDYIGPNGEYLNTVTRPLDQKQATQQLLDERLGPPAHGTVMFRKSVYQQVGGYRPQFYYAQDSDLWLRMAEVSNIAYVPESGYRFRRHQGSITGSSGSRQKEFGRLGQACRTARRDGLPEQPFLDEASALTEEILANRRAGRKQVGDETEMAYLLGSQLAQNGDARARKYLFSVLGKQPWHMRAWVRLAQSLTGGRDQCIESRESE